MARGKRAKIRANRSDREILRDTLYEAMQNATIAILETNKARALFYARTGKRMTDAEFVLYLFKLRLNEAHLIEQRFGRAEGAMPFTTKAKRQAQAVKRAERNVSSNR